MFFKLNGIQSVFSIPDCFLIVKLRSQKFKTVQKRFLKLHKLQTGFQTSSKTVSLDIFHWSYTTDFYLKISKASKYVFWKPTGNSTLKVRNHSFSAILFRFINWNNQNKNSSKKKSKRRKKHGDQWKKFFVDDFNFNFFSSFWIWR